MSLASQERTSKYPSLLLARSGWILVVAGLTLAGAAVFSWLQTPTYTSEATVLVEPQASTGAAPAEPNMGTEKQVAMSTRVAMDASGRLDVPWKRLQDGLSVNVPVDTWTLKFTYSHAKPSEAQQRAQALAESYVGVRSAQPLWTYGVITPAALPTSPATPNYAVNLGVALLVGLALGVATAFVRDHVDDRLRGPADLEAQADAPVLAVIPPAGQGMDEATGSLVTLREPSSRAAEAYRFLRARVLQTAADRGASTLLVTSPAEAEGKTTTAANLAATLALSGKSVILVDGDLHRPRLHKLFAVDGEVGLVDVLAGQVELPAALRETGVRGLHLLAVGSAPSSSQLPPPSELLADAFLKDVLVQLSGDADLVVIDSAPLLSAAGTLSLADLADMVLLVADARISRRSQINEAGSQMEDLRGNLIGAVFNNAPRGANGTLLSYANQNDDLPATAAPAWRRIFAKRHRSAGRSHSQLDLGEPPNGQDHPRSR